MLTRLIESIVAALRRLFGGSSRSPGSSQTPPGASPKLLPCQNTKELRAVQTIGPDGGTLQVGDHRLVIPRGALGDKVELTGVLLVDRVLKVRIQANGADSFQFRQPVSLTLSYAKCEGVSGAQQLRVYKIDPATNQVIRDHGGTVDPRARAVTAPLDSLSTYTLGYPAKEP